MKMSEQDIAFLLEGCRSGDVEKQRDALVELQTCGDETCLPDILPLFSSPDVEVRQLAVETASILGTNQANFVGSLLLPLLTDKSELVRSETAEALGVVIYPPAIEALKERLKEDPEWVVRCSAAEALGSYQDQTIVAALEERLHDDEEDISVQSYAAYSLGKVADARYLPRLHVLYATGDWDPRVERNLLGAGYRLGGEEYLDELLTKFEQAEKEECGRLLNLMEGLLTDRPYPPTVKADSERIRAALHATAHRWSMTAKQVRDIEERLSTLLGE